MEGVAVATTVHFDWKSNGFRQILHSAGVQAALVEQGQRIAAASGRRCQVRVWAGSYGGGRSICSVSAVGKDADLDLLRAV